MEKNIIQTWKTRQVPAYLMPLAQTWKNQNGFQYHLFDDSDIERFVKDQYPDFFSTFQKLLPVEKADVFRLMIIYHKGGIYADMDTSCRCDLNKLYETFKDYSFIVGTEVLSDTLHHISNWTFIIEKHHPSLKRIIETLIVHIEKNPMLPTIKKTGPAIFSSLVFKSIKTDPTIKILPIKYFGAGQKHSMSPPVAGGYIVHHFMGSWKKKVSLSKKIRFFISGKKVMSQKLK